MSKIAFVFAGQGSQYTGMGKELCEASQAAAKVFEQADALRPGTSEQCFTATREELSQTAITQPCVYCVDLAAAEALREAGILPQAVAGFSLGEVAALTFAEGFSREDGFRFVCRRGEVMDRAAQKEKSGMAAVLRLDHAQVEALCRQFIHAYPVNYNCPGQVTVAAGEAELPAFCAAVKEAGGKTVPLAVSGGFHSPFMDSAAQILEREVPEYRLKQPELSVFSNRTALPYAGAHERLEELLVKQVISPVQWEKTIRTMIKEGIDTFVEVGPGKTLSGFIKKISGDVTILRVEDKETLEQTVQVLKA